MGNRVMVSVCSNWNWRKQGASIASASGTVICFFPLFYSFLSFACSSVPVLPLRNHT